MLEWDAHYSELYVQTTELDMVQTDLVNVLS